MEVIESPLLRSKHVFVIPDPRIDMTGESLRHIRQNPEFSIVEIPDDAKLPDILWKFHRSYSKKRTPIRNPHFYPRTAIEAEEIKEVFPLRDRNAKGDGKWTDRIYVYGDIEGGRIRLTSQDETTARLFGAVTPCLSRRVPLTLFKGLLVS